MKASAKSSPRRRKGDPVVRQGKDGRFLNMKAFRPHAMKEGAYLGIKLLRARLRSDIQTGLPASTVEVLRSRLDVTQETMFRYLSISNGTYARRKEGGNLNTHESERVFRYAHLFSLATEMMMGDEAKAKAWLKASKEILGGATPLEYAETEIGAREVEDYICRIMDGTYS